jgi:hypothetical protein
LEERNGVALLDDNLIEIATAEVLPGKKTRAKITAEIKQKERAVATLKSKYRSSKLTVDDIHLCLYSIGYVDTSFVTGLLLRWIRISRSFYCVDD